jgi:hypothetical protein
MLYFGGCLLFLCCSKFVFSDLSFVSFRGKIVFVLTAHMYSRHYFDSKRKRALRLAYLMTRRLVVRMFKSIVQNGAQIHEQSSNMESKSIEIRLEWIPNPSKINKNGALGGE